VVQTIANLDDQSLGQQNAGGFMIDYEKRALECDQWAAERERATEQNNLRAAELRRWAAQKLSEAQEHPDAIELLTTSEEMMAYVAFWERHAATERARAAKLRLMARSLRTGICSDL